MYKSQMIEAIASKAGLPKTKAAAALEATIDEIKKSLKKEGSVSLKGLGTFAVRKRAARKGRNPATGAAVKIPASKVVRFKASGAVKLMLNPARKPA